jgi:hypothetical protein
MEDVGEVTLMATGDKWAPESDPVSFESTEECTPETLPPRHENQPKLGEEAEFGSIP